MRAEHFDQASLRVRVPRGNDGFWQIICQLAKSQGTFTIADIDGESCVNAQLIRKYVRLLIAGGFVESISADKKKFVAPTYRLLKAARRAPRIRPDGSLIHGNAIDALWTTIRCQPVFTLKELVWTATTPEVKPSYALAKRYVNYLTTAGYLAAGSSRGRTTTYRLKPAMNTGPLPPRLKAVRANAMWDPNLKTFVGEPAEASEAA